MGGGYSHCFRLSTVPLIDHFYVNVGITEWAEAANDTSVLGSNFTGIFLCHILFPPCHLVMKRMTTVIK